jgi:hypothetical protein
MHGPSDPADGTPIHDAVAAQVDNHARVEDSYGIQDIGGCRGPGRDTDSEDSCVHLGELDRFGKRHGTARDKNRHG